ncbi:hypothetical protein BUH_6234 [Burkholderia pseudomallei Pakistan 9]|nr:hypothetical protein BUH_6234 [Burkholderia pseudomallei Pakistan 9]
MRPAAPVPYRTVPHASAWGPADHVQRGAMPRHMPDEI